jgi:hypothetical protein
LAATVGSVKALLTGDVSNSTVTAAKITGLDTTLGPGTYKFEYWIRHQAAATTTGIKFSVYHTGTVGWIVYNMRYASAGSLQATAAQSQNASTVSGNLVEAWGRRGVSNTANVGPTASIDAANSDALTVIEGLLEITVSGNIELYHASEVAAQTTVKAGTVLLITPVY